MLWTLHDTPASQLARSIAQRLHAAGFLAYFAGGAVRDLILNRIPDDFDLATSATPNQILALLATTNLRTFAVGAHFGVILAVSDQNETRVEVEIATFRHDGAYHDGRRPESVRFTLDPREDVERRDFTINGLLLDPTNLESLPVPRIEKNNRHPERSERPLYFDLLGTPVTDAQPHTVPESAILDFVEGRADLDARLIRAIGDPNLRFAEDKLRMLRAVRFAARLSFAIEPQTLAAIRHNAAEITQVSNERVRDELTRMLTEGAARRAFELLDETDLLPQVLPEIARMKGVAQPHEFHPEGDVWVHTLGLLAQIPAGTSAELAWGMLLHDVGKPATYQPPNPAKPGDRIRFNGHPEVGIRIAEDLLARLRFSADSTARITDLIRHHMRFGDILSMKLATLKRFIRLPHFADHLALHRADCLAAHGDLRNWTFATEAYQADQLEPEATHPAWLVTGTDLIEAGYRPGPHFKAMLRHAEDAQLESRIQTTAEGLTLIATQFGPPTG
jgi:poly(A) polymerase